MNSRERPRRLERLFQQYSHPVYFVTFCTFRRQKVLATPEVHTALQTFGERGWNERRVALGRYVVMPDHVHLFVAHVASLSQWARMLKTVLGRAISNPAPEDLWQRGFFDHVLRSSESYAEKWSYIRDNPVRAGLVADPEEWPYQGEIVPF